MAVWGSRKAAKAHVPAWYVSTTGGDKGYVPMLLVDREEDEQDQKIMVHVRMLREPSMAALLETAAQQFGHGQRGVLRIPCDLTRKLQGAKASVPAWYACAAAGGKVPRGYVPMVLDAGEEDEQDQRILVHVRMLQEPSMAALLEKAAQQFGHGQRGVLRIPCDLTRFEQMMEDQWVDVESC
ncbi:hypothetical protein EJB05_00185, partial [Eragrostis curvula]